MNHFHNAKIIATIGPAIDKETVLSKVINQIDVFRINLSHGDEETKKKYIDTILKLDSSKTVMLDTRGPEIRTRNKDEMTLKKNQKITVAFAEFFKQETWTLFIDYPNIHRIESGTIMSIDNDAVKIEVLSSKDGLVSWKVIHGGTILINRNVEFENYIPKLAFLSEKDKKQIARWVDNKITVIAVSYIRDQENIATIRQYLTDIGGKNMKIVAKIETKEAVDNIEEIIRHTDGININRTKLRILVGEKRADAVKRKIILLCNQYGKPLIMTTGFEITWSSNAANRKIIKEEIAQWVDSFLLTKETAVSDKQIDFVTQLYDMINDEKNIVHSNYQLKDLHSTAENSITDYIIFNAYRASREMTIKAIICPTESGYTPARLSSLKPNVPIIAFTKNDDAYRYLNLLWWVKGYKISNSFEYTNIKQIGKEIIRILFKGNISLDDQILIVHSSLEQNMPGMINGMELYKFKDI